MNSQGGLRRVEQSTTAEPHNAEHQNDAAVISYNMPMNPLAQRIMALAPAEGANESGWPGLHCNRISQPTAWSHVVYRPSLCVVAQGHKEAILAERVYQYNPRQFLVLTLPLPLEARVVEATPEQPFLSLSLELDFGQLHDLVARLPRPGAVADGLPAIRVSSMTTAIESCLVHLLDALAHPQDRQVIAPLAMRELHYRLLCSEQGDLLHAAAARDSNAVKAQRVVHYLEQHYDQALDVPAIAAATNMSVSSLHHTFKAATALTPMQYLKRIRLHRARLLLMDETHNASDAAYQVGYNSVAQFSRDFKQQFGLTPSRHRKENKAAIAQP